jgi:hypothetical protein
MNECLTKNGWALPPISVFTLNDLVYTSNGWVYTLNGGEPIFVYR